MWILCGKGLIHKYVKLVRDRTILICADMIEHAVLPLDRSNDLTYRLAQKEFAQMLRDVANGKIRLDNIDELMRKQNGDH